MSVDNKLEGRLIIPDRSINKTPPFNQLFGERKTRRDLLKGAALFFGGAAALKASATLAEENTEPSIDIAGVQIKPPGEVLPNEATLTENTYIYNPSEVTDKDIDYIKKAEKNIREIATAEFAFAFVTPLTFTISADPTAGQEARPPDQVFYSTKSNAWLSAYMKSEQNRDLRRVTNAGHEIGHTLTYAFNPEVALLRIKSAQNTSYGGPAWLWEGSAEWITYKAAGNAGMMSFQSARECQPSAVLSNNTASIRMLESRTDFNKTPGNNYAAAFQAVAMLIEMKGPMALRAYYEGLSPESASEGQWQDVFQLVFGINIEDFYQKYDAWRQAYTQPNPGVCSYRS